MFDAKLLNWMCRGSSELNQCLNAIDRDLIEEVVAYEFRIPTKEILGYYSKHKIPPNTDVLRELLSVKDQDEYVCDLIDSENEMTEQELGHVVDSIKKRFNTKIIKKFAKAASSEEDTLEELNKDIHSLMIKTQKLYKNSVFSEGEISKSTHDRLNEYHWIKENPGQAVGILSGLRSLDDYTWGIKKSEMMVIGGASSSGKSLLMMNMAINAWKGQSGIEKMTFDKNAKNVLYISLEMTKSQLEKRIDANLACVRHRNLSRGTLDHDEFVKYEKSLKFQEKHDKTFYILDLPRGSTIADIESKYETILGLFQPDAVFVDYLQLMKPSIGATGTDWIDVGRVSEELHEFCRKQDVAVITAAQRKAAQKSSAKKKVDNIDIEDLGRSKMIGDNATVIMLIANREDELLREDMEVHIVKNRDGAKGKVNLRKVFDKSRVEEFPDDWVADDGDENDI
jgi:replicative DNA helicase